MVDQAVAGTRGQDVVIPGQGPYTGGVPRHGAEAAAFLGVPYLYEAFVCTY